METTGLEDSIHNIIEISAVKYENGSRTETFSQLINPERNIPIDASDKNGITNSDVKNCPTIEKVMPKFDEFIGNYPVVAHNLKFDLGFVYKNKSNITVQERNYYCTFQESKRILRKKVDNYKLTTLCDYFGIYLNQAHRAEADAVACAELFLELQNYYQNK